MLFATAVKKINRLVAPAMLKHGLSAQFILSRGNAKDNPYLDYALLLPFAQKLLSIEIQEIAQEKKMKLLQEKNKKPSAFDEFVDKVWDKYLEPMSFKEEEKKSSGNLRLDAFEDIMRPILTPTNEWVNIERYRFNQRFIKWLRSEYLVCKFEEDIRNALAVHTQLKVTPLLQKNAFKETIRKGLLGKADTSMGEYAPLPTAETLNKAFNMKDWNKSKAASHEYDHMTEIANRIGGYMEEIPGTNVKVPTVPVEAPLKDLTLEEVLEVSGCHISSSSAFNALCEEAGIYEFWTEDYVRSLGNYIMDRCQNFDGETVVLDIGAGDGSLVYFLKRYMKEAKETSSSSLGNKKNQKISKKNKNLPTVVATDDFSWKIDPKAEVEKLSVSDALQKYQPFDENGKRSHQLIVICSWQPMGIDWTQQMRDLGADEYILIGESDDGNCGDNWLTFGNPEFRDDIHLSEEESKQMEASVIPPYKRDGFVRVDLDDLSKMQYSRFDSSVSSSSKTISFRRRESKK